MVHVSLTNELQKSGNIAMFHVSLDSSERKEGSRLVVRDENGKMVASQLVADLPEEISVGCTGARF